MKATSPKLKLVSPEPPAPTFAPDATLVQQALAGDISAEDALYRKHANDTFRLVIRLLGNSDEAEDMVHDAFVGAFTRLATLRDRSAFRAWLRQIAVMRVRQAIRWRRMRRALGLLPGRDDPGLETLAGKTAPPDARTDLAVVDRVLSELDVDSRIAWVIRFVEGAQLEEVAELVGASLATVKRRIRKAEREIAAAIAHGGPS